MTFKERIRDFVWFMFRDRCVCPVCKCDSVVYASFRPYVFCGECGWELRKGYFRNETVDCPWCHGKGLLTKDGEPIDGDDSDWI